MTATRRAFILRGASGMKWIEDAVGAAWLAACSNVFLSTLAPEASGERNESVWLPLARALRGQANADVTAAVLAWSTRVALTVSTQRPIEKKDDV